MDKLSKAIQVLEDQINYSVRNMDEVSVELDFETADVILELLKAQQPKKKGKWKCDVGHWIEGERETGEMIDTYACSYCGFYQYWKTPFCPNCGAVMNQDGEQ